MWQSGQAGNRDSQRETGDRQTDREGQMDMPTARLDGEFWSQVDKQGGDCQVTRLQALWSAHVTPSVRQEDWHITAAPPLLTYTPSNKSLPPSLSVHLFLVYVIIMSFVIKFFKLQNIHSIQIPLLLLKFYSAYLNTMNFVFAHIPSFTHLIYCLICSYYLSVQLQPFTTV